jgi:serine protease Do
MARLLTALAGATLALTLAGPASAAPPAPLWSSGALETGISPDSPIAFNAFTKLAAQAAPAVVSIETESVQRMPRGGFFGSGRATRGAGSGFIINADGHLLTNHHVIDHATSIQVHLLDGRTFTAEVLGSDPATDLALLKITPKGAPLPTVPLGDSDALEIGAWVVAIGNPMGLSHTVTAGIVSAKGRREVRPGRELRYADFIQTDASINPGNSGGPLFNLRGQVVGINSAINARAQGIGFAIPANMVKTIVRQLAEDGSVDRSWIGVAIQPITEPLARSFGLEQAQGALISNVVDGGPAAKAGLEPGDLITAFGDSPIKAHDDLPWLASTAGVGRTIPLTVLRDGRTRTIPITLERLPGQDTAPASLKRGKRPLASPRKVLGITLEPISPRAARRLGTADGVLVAGIDPGSPAAEAGLRPGDVIRRCNGTAVHSVHQLDKKLDTVKAKSLVRLLVKRGRNSVFLAFER